jgi:hypothetical protein
MKKYYPLLLASLLSASMFAQNNTTYFYGNNFRWAQNTRGMLFSEIENGMPGLEVEGSGRFAIFAHNLIFAGLDSLGEARSHYQ